mmetsp:Transcript_35427/g.66106  ORF Transcript_35427/g.66106 Transcript_35427/m.66106 type:complete len:422 (+) Transcript_35427:86-1351(+)|eukprot:CAMPEP_0114432322 /NCGR_PEP_ID=MMETSP0103-20121206/11091_1 /TAXON_ID=37642 ORGANISM="Paraphysomonas imperforata, Strain PA2" /NCGR_SAMPLE_ID=MMETSP0103 /ASSEMBLY_ACC=CAM_ASM_000201 /LENGTH=421 /DNA_ID=CAMNT_0001601985 /DNA_START=53 /DNA_END=1318 /DNA_ORIENTATION=+
MSFLWGKSKPSTDSSKARQVADLAACFPSIRRPNNDDNSFELAFEIDRSTNNLRIWLPSDFPANKPTLQVIGPVQHPWLDQYKRVAGCDKLTYWNGKTSTLREVVELTLSELRKTSAASQQRPPQAGQQPQMMNKQQHVGMSQQTAQFQQPGQQQSLAHSHISPSMQYQQQHPQQQYQHQPPQQQHHPQHQRPQQYQQQQYQQHQRPQQYHQHQQQATAYQQVQNQKQYAQPQNTRRPSADLSPQPNDRPKSDRSWQYQITLPGAPNEFPELHALEVTQLERLMKDEVAKKAHAAEHECMETLRSIRDDLCKSNADHARRNLEKRGDIGSEEEEILILQNKLRATANSYKSKLNTYQKKHALSKEDIISALNKELASLDNTSEDLAENFVRGESDVVTYLKEYLKIREEYHALKLTLKKAI